VPESGGMSETLDSGVCRRGGHQCPREVEAKLVVVQAARCSGEGAAISPKDGLAPVVVTEPSS
jgi:hypothetical protein